MILSVPSNAAIDAVESRTFAFVNAKADEAKDRIDKILVDMGSREPARLDAARNAVIITDQRTRIQAIAEIMPLLDQPSTQPTRMRRIMEMNIRLSQHYIAKKKAFELVQAPSAMTPSAASAPAGLGTSPMLGVPPQSVRPAIERPAMPPAITGLRLRGIMMGPDGQNMALLYRDNAPYLLRKGRLLEGGVYPVPGVTGVIHKDRVILQARQKEPLILLLYEKTDLN